MKKEITLDQERIEYTVEKSFRARRLKLIISRAGTVRIVIPSFMSESSGNEFIKAKARWVQKTLKKIKKLPTYFPGGGGRDYLKLKDSARAIAMERIAFFNTTYCFPVRTITIKNQKARWGSCSAQGNLNFNYKIVELPPELRDYIIVHELCHLKEMNHGPRFWKLVGDTIPDYMERRQRLRGHIE